MNLLQSEVIDAPIASVEVALQGYRESSQAIPGPASDHSCWSVQLYPPDVPAEREDAITWARFDDNYDSNPKIRMAGRDGKNLHEVSIRWSCRLKTDGHIPKAVLPELGILAQLPGNKPLQRRAAERLVELNLWEDLGDGWHIHDFSTYAAPQRYVTPAVRHESVTKNHAEDDPDPTRTRPVVSLEKTVIEAIHKLGFPQDQLEGLAEKAWRYAVGKGARNPAAWLLSRTDPSRVTALEDFLARCREADWQATKEAERDTPAVISLPKLRRVE